ncbi:MAG: copper chaperone PCu(A)C [Actinomycetota bacterium]|nr:copper chaperone PCu(A)C [Actinomycetota bacterium]
MRTRHLAKATLVAAALATALVACGDDDDDAVDTGSEDAAESSEASASGVEVSGVWARTSPANAENGAVYMELTSADGDALLGASVDASVAGTVEIHETVMADMDEDEGTSDDMSEDSAEGEDMAEGDHEGMDGMDGAMTMQPVESLELPAGEAVVMEPGGYHVMLLELAEPLEAGGTFDLVLDFETAEDETISVEVRDEAP